MSDETARPPSEPLVAQIEALRRRLSTLEKHELVELAAQLTATYVLEGLGTIGQATLEATPAAKGYDAVGDETFAGMLRRLKVQRPNDPALEKFIVNGEHIQVRTPMGNVDVTEYRRPVAPASAPVTTPPPASMPTPRESVYNRELYGEPPANQRGTAPRPNAAAAGGATSPNGPAPAQNRPAAPPPANPAGQPAAAKDANAKEPAGKDRFRMIELD
jgi:hypothetical protein